MLFCLVTAEQRQCLHDAASAHRFMVYFGIISNHVTLFVKKCKPHYVRMVSFRTFQHGQPYFPSELQLNKANVSDTKASFLDLNFSISDGFVKTIIYDKRDDFEFDIVHFPLLDGDVTRSTSYGVYFSQLIRFARVSSHVDDFNTRYKVLRGKPLRQGFM